MESAATQQLPIQAHHRKWWVMFAVGLMLVMINLDLTIVNLAVPTIARSLNGTLFQMQWVINAYFLMTTIFLIIGGKLSDIYGKRKVYLIGAAIFVIASFFCGMSSSVNFLIASRTLQGIGFGVVFPVLIAIVYSVFPEHQRGLAVSIVSATAGLTQALGPTLGGMLIHFMSWRWIFLLNFPIGLISLFLMFFIYTTENLPGQKKKFDYIGVLLYGLGILGTTFALIKIRLFGWTEFIFPILLAISILILIFFVIHQLKKSEPLFDFRLLKIRNYAIATAIRSLCMCSYFVLLFILPLYLQGPQSETPLHAGYVLLMMTVCFGGLSIFVGMLSKKISFKKLLIVGNSIFVVGIVLLMSLKSGSSLYFLSLGLMATGIATAFYVTLATALAFSAVPLSQTGAASGIYFSISMAGGVIGTTMAASLLDWASVKNVIAALNQHQMILGSSVKKLLLDTANGLHPVNAFLKFPDSAIANKLMLIAKQAFMHGYFLAISFALIPVVLSLLASFLINTKAHYTK